MVLPFASRDSKKPWLRPIAVCLGHSILRPPFDGADGKATTSLPLEPRPLPLGDSEFDDGLGWNLDLLLRLGIEARTCLPLLFYQLAKTGQDEFAVLFHRFVGEVAERIDEYSSRLLIGLGCFGKCDLQFCLGHLQERYSRGLSLENRRVARKSKRVCQNDGSSTAAS